MTSNQVTLPKARGLSALAATAALVLLAGSALRAQSVSAPLSITTLAGTAGVRQATDATGSAAAFYGPAGLAFDGSGNLIVADSCNQLIRKVTTTGTVTTIAGLAMSPSHPSSVGSADGTGVSASFSMGAFQSSGGSFDPPVWAHSGSNTIAIDASGNVYVADTNNYTVRKVTSAGVVTTIAGQAGANGYADGSGSSARFLAPGGAAIDSSGNIFVTDSGNNTIRKITPDGTVSTFAGTPRVSGTADGTGSAAAFYNPQGIAIDGANNLYVADTGNHTIRKITAGAVVTTLAGGGGQSGTADGTGAQARFNKPVGLAVDANGYIYVADSANNAIRKISPSGTVTTVAGSKGTVGSADGIGTNALFNQPIGVAVDSSGAIYISDFGNNILRKGVISSTADSLTITAIPSSTVKVTAGTNVTYKIAATGSPTPTYQWSKSGTAIAGATNATLALNSVSAIDAGNYSVLVTSGSLSYSSAPSTLTVYLQNTTVPVTIVTQPADRVVTAGQSTTFTVEASATSAISYQWSKDGTAITGATNASYTIAAAQTADVGIYTVALTATGYSAATTNGAALSVTGGVPPVKPVFSVQPIPQSLYAGATLTLTASATGTPSPTYQWQKDGADVANSATISGATSTTLTVTNFAAANAGSSVLVATNAGGTTTSTAAAVTLVTPVKPTFGTQPSSQAVNAGTAVTFTASASGSPTPTYQWQKDGVNLANSATVSGVTTTTLTLASVSSTDLGNYTLVATNIAGSTTSTAAALTLNIGPNAWLTNVSVRTTIKAGQGPVIVGIVTNGQKDVLVRASGPGLAPFVADPVLPDPSLQMYKGQTVVAANDNWDASLATLMHNVGAFPWATGSKDAALVQTINTDANYTAWGLPTGSGLVLFEGYDTQPDVNIPRLINVSARNDVGSGSDVLIAGFAVRGTGTKKLLIRGVGPTLATAPYNVTNALLDPILEVYDSNNVLIATNDNWDYATIDATAKSVGAFNLVPGSKDAAMIISLAADSPAPKNYTAMVKGVGGATGNALVEVYEVP